MSLTVEFKAVTSGQCSWCGRDKDELFEVEFGDRSFAGTFCRGDLMKAIAVKVPKKAGQAASSPLATDVHVRT